MEVKPVIKGRIHYDEKYIHVGKGHGYDLNAIASKSKYIHAHLYAKERDLEACVKFLRQIKITCKEQIMEVYNKEKHKPVKKRKLITFVSDKFENARKAKLFGMPKNLSDFSCITGMLSTSFFTGHAN